MLKACTAHFTHLRDLPVVRLPRPQGRPLRPLRLHLVQRRLQVVIERRLLVLHVLGQVHVLHGQVHGPLQPLVPQVHLLLGQPAQRLLRVLR